MITKKKFKIDIEGSEFNYLPTKKIELIAKREDGEYVISKFENLVKVEAKQIMKRNPDKKILFEKYNQFKEKVQLAHYKNNDFVNLFIDGGVHPVRFTITLEDLNNLIHVLNDIRIRIINYNKTASQVHVQNSKGDEK
jgi:hypothetical protein